MAMTAGQLNNAFKNSSLLIHCKKLKILKGVMAAPLAWSPVQPLCSYTATEALTKDNSYQGFLVLVKKKKTARKGKDQF